MLGPWDDDLATRLLKSLPLIDSWNARDSAMLVIVTALTRIPKLHGVDETQLLEAAS